MTVPKTFRRSAAIPNAVVLHIAEVPAADIERIDGVPVTKALRTLIDMATSGEIPLADLERGFAEAVESGSITRADISAAKMGATRRQILHALRGQAGLMPGSRKFTSQGALRQPRQSGQNKLGILSTIRLYRIYPPKLSIRDSPANEPFSHCL
jgi:hypothetical protein